MSIVYQSILSFPKNNNNEDYQHIPINISFPKQSIDELKRQYGISSSNVSRGILGYAEVVYLYFRMGITNALANNLKENWSLGGGFAGDAKSTPP